MPGRPDTSDPRPTRARNAPRAADQAQEFELLTRAREGDRDALAELLSRYEAPVYNLCLRMIGPRQPHLAADVAQDALVRIIEKLDAFDGRSLLSTWIYRVTANVCLSRLRAEKLRRHAPLDEPATPQDPNRPSRSGGQAEPDAASGIQTRERHRLVVEALSTLDEDQRLILILRDTHGLDYEQIAEAIGTPVGTVKSRLFRARAALRKAVERLEDESASP